jgi:hypothetical protein
MRPITQDTLREIVPDFAQAIRAKKTKTAKPAFAVINFRNERQQNHERPIETVPIDLLRYRKDNGRIASDVMNYEKLNGRLDEKDKDAQEILRGFLENKHPEMTVELISSIEHMGQSEPAIITCDGFLINGNRRKMAFESLRKRHSGVEDYSFMKVVILPGPGEEGGPPTLLEIERLENRYQLQSEGKSEYYNFDRALSIKRKMELGFTLEDQLKDDPRYVRATEQELKKAIKQYEREYIWPLECADRYLQQFDREGMYATISSGKSDREGRWQAFIDYSNIYNTRLKNQKWQIENKLDEEDIGSIEEAAFKMIRLRTLKGLPKIHHVMRELPKICALKESRKEILNIANEVDSSLPQDEQFDAEGNPLSLDVVDKKWAQHHQQKMIMHTKKALDFVEAFREKETPLMLLEAAFKKLTHDNFSVENIPYTQYSEARKLAVDIQKIAKDIENQIYDNDKKLKDFARKK